MAAQSLQTEEQFVGSSFGIAQAAGAVGAGMGGMMMMMGDLGFQEGGKYEILILIDDKG